MNAFGGRGICPGPLLRECDRRGTKPAKSSPSASKLGAGAGGSAKEASRDSLDGRDDDTPEPGEFRCRSCRSPSSNSPKPTVQFKKRYSPRSSGGLFANRRDRRYGGILRGKGVSSRMADAMQGRWARRCRGNDIFRG